MSAGPVKKTKGMGPGSAPSSFQFVTATANLSQFKDRDTMRHVRKTVMHTYLTKAEHDPDCKDVRVVKKRQPVKKKKSSPEVSPGTSPITTDAGGVPVESNVPALTRRSYSPVERSDQSLALNSSAAPPTSRVVALHSPSPTGTRNRHPLLTSPKSKQGSPDGSSDSSVIIVNPDDSRYADMALVERRDIQREQIVFDVAYSHAYGLHIDSLMPDPFASMNPLENENVNIALLKKNCSKYYGSRAMLRQWTSFQTVAPAAFLSCLCISAPYTDLMSKSHTWMDAGPNAQIDSQTLELLTEVPKLVNESLEHQGQEISDTNIVAVVQLLAGQITSDYTWIVPAHRSYLKHMIARRGGFDKLGGNGIIGAVICQTDFEAAFMNNEPFDRSYLEYARQYVRDRPDVKFPAPESPVLARNPGMMSIAANKNCSSQTLTVIVLMHQLTRACHALNRSERLRSSPVGPHQVDDTDSTALRSTMHDISRKLHQMLPASSAGHNAHNDFYYETLRLAAILYAHAILHRIPFHEAAHVHCSQGRVIDDQHSSCLVTPSMVQQALLRTDMARAWERLGGSLYWVVMVAGAAYYKPGRPVSPSFEPRKDSFMPSARKSSGHALHSTESAPPAHRISSPSAPTGVDISATATTGAASSTHQTWTSINASRAGPSQPGQCYKESPTTWQPLASRRSDLLQGYLDSTPALSATSSLAGSSGHNTPSPPPTKSAVASTYFAPVLHVGQPQQQQQQQHQRQLVVPGTQAMASQAAYRLAESHVATNTAPSPPAEEEESQNTKRPRTRITGQASVKVPIRPSCHDEEEQYRKRYLIANAVRISILLRFEHTTAMMKAVLGLGEVQDYLNRRQS